ncbi:putative reverse transcriptase zinc-binding domain-containing protein [Helianthus anomalus]
MWVKVVDAIHSKGESWSFLPVKKSCNGVWNNIVSVISKPVSGNVILRDLFRGVVGKGDRIMFWLDPWLREKPLCEIFPNIFALEVVKSCSIRDRLEGTWLWKHDPEPGEELDELSVIMDELAEVSLNSNEDGWRWLGDPKGSFSVKSVKSVLAEASSVGVDFVLEWNKWVPSKCNLLVWKAEMGRIPTADALSKRGIVTGEGLCPLCKSETESVDHLFTSCIVAAVLWQKVSIWCRIPPIFAFSFKDLLEVHVSSRVSVTMQPVIQGVVFTVVWCLWMARNKASFSGIEAKVESIFCNVKSLGFLWFKYRSKNNHISWLEWCNFSFF